MDWNPKRSAHPVPEPAACFLYMAPFATVVSLRLVHARQGQASSKSNQPPLQGRARSRCTSHQPYSLMDMVHQFFHPQGRAKRQTTGRVEEDFMFKCRKQAGLPPSGLGLL